MSKRKVVRRLSTNNLTKEEKEKIRKQKEERDKQALGRAIATIKPSSQTNKSPGETDEQAKDQLNADKQTDKKQELIGKITQRELSQKNGQETTENQINRPTFDPKSKLKRKVSFDEKYKRITTYVLNEHYAKLQEVRKTYGISITETVNVGLKMYFDKYNL